MSFLTSLPPSEANICLAKVFSRALVSFALLPFAACPTKLASNIVAINAAGDIEIHEIHDVPKSPMWSSIGNLTVSAGMSCKTYSGGQHVAAREPWDIDFVSNFDLQKALEEFSTANEFLATDRSGKVKDSFSTLKTPQRESSLTATRRLHGKTYSPASIRRYTVDRQVEYTVQTRVTDLITTTTEPSKVKVKRQSKQYPTNSELRSAEQLKVLQEDISILMMARVSLGYGLTSVNLMFHFLSRIRLIYHAVFSQRKSRCSI